MSDSDYSNQDLSGRDFSNAILERINLRGANLTGAIFKGAVLTDANLQESCLRDADFTDVRGLMAGQLRGCDVTGAKLPPEISKFEALGVAAEASKNASAIFLSLLIACAYAWLTIASTTDAGLLTNTALTQLPIIKHRFRCRHSTFARHCCYSPFFSTSTSLYRSFGNHSLHFRLGLPTVVPYTSESIPGCSTSSLAHSSFQKIRNSLPFQHYKPLLLGYSLGGFFP